METQIPFFLSNKLLAINFAVAIFQGSFYPINLKLIQQNSYEHFCHGEYLQLQLFYMWSICSLKRFNLEILI